MLQIGLHKIAQHYCGGGNQWRESMCKRQPAHHGAWAPQRRALRHQGRCGSRARLPHNRRGNAAANRRQINGME
jgi:hypothetical protein